MKGTWGRRVYGSVRKGAKYTRFRLEIVMDNDCTIYETAVVPNDELEQYPTLYPWTLNNLTEKLIKRLEARAQ